MTLDDERSESAFWAFEEHHADDAWRAGSWTRDGDTWTTLAYRDKGRSRHHFSFTVLFEEGTARILRASSGPTYLVTRECPSCCEEWDEDHLDGEGLCPDCAPLHPCEDDWYARRDH